MSVRLPELAVLVPGEPFPPLDQTWPDNSPAPGLLAIGGALDAPTLLAAYRHTVFPWFNADEPILWWSTNPRMVLHPDRLRLHRSLRKTIQRFRADARCQIHFNTAFDQVIAACAAMQRPGQNGTWIGPEMQAAYIQLHAAGHAHSVETWVDGQLVAGLYLVSIGQAVFGESMFTQVSDGSKIALAALVAFCRMHGLPLIDCQQNTEHLAFMGAQEMPRDDFAQHVQALTALPAPVWKFDPVYWNAILPTSTHPP
ncbi:leucyl/phenylalanyl-tRNA--protein transferase [Ottowia sp.]|uniref:leucyl/phenylalanyl-tRNA--protein transferase n=1 Tax=Ottowia sp. TaxID=1898956 RepID=UPI003A83CFE9